MHYVEESDIKNILRRYRYASDWVCKPQSWIYNLGDNTILIPAIEDGPLDQDSLNSIVLVLWNITGSWMWEQRVEELVIEIACSINLTVNHVWLFDDNYGERKLELNDMTGSGTNFTLTHRFSYMELARMSIWRGHVWSYTIIQENGTSQTYHMGCSTKIHINVSSGLILDGAFLKNSRHIGRRVKKKKCNFCLT